jgi:hypothetical protein
MPPEPTKAHRRHMEYCSAHDCNRNKRYKGYCPRHYEQVRRTGRVLEVTKFDRRPAILQDDIALIPLGVEAKDGHTVVDASDSWVDRYNWCRDKLHGYAVGYVDGRNTALHRLIASAPRGVQIDHRDTNKLNNRRSNLRFATFSRNAANTPLRSTNTSGYKGVVRADGGFTARMTYKRRSIYIGYYSTAEEAAAAYDRRATELFGAYARTNRMLTSQ